MPFKKKPNLDLDHVTSFLQKQMDDAVSPKEKKIFSEYVKNTETVRALTKQKIEAMNNTMHDSKFKNQTKEQRKNIIAETLHENTEPLILNKDLLGNVMKDAKQKAQHKTAAGIFGLAAGAVTGAAVGTPVGLQAAGTISIPAVAKTVAAMKLLLPLALSNPIGLGITAGLLAAAIVGLVSYSAYRKFSQPASSFDNDDNYETHEEDAPLLTDNYCEF